MSSSEPVHADPINQFSITRAGLGWHVSEVRDSRLVRSVTYTDWHRVERARRMFEISTPPPASETRARD